MELNARADEKKMTIFRHIVSADSKMDWSKLKIQPKKKKKKKGINEKEKQLNV